MKYNFFIDFGAVMNSGFTSKTDVNDWLILDYIRQWEASDVAIRQVDRVWINYAYLIKQMPILKITSKAAVSKRISKLESLGLLDAHHDFVEQCVFIKTTQTYRDIYAAFGTSDIVRKRENAPKLSIVRNQRMLDRGRVYMREISEKADEEAGSFISQTVILDQAALETKKVPVNESVPISTSRYIYQDTCNASMSVKKNEQPSKPVENKFEKSSRVNLPQQSCLLAMVAMWYVEQGYKEDIEKHFDYFLGRLKTYSYMPRDLVGHFKRAIEEDWARLRTKKAYKPDWAIIPDEDGDFVGFINKHGYPQYIRDMLIPQAQAELRRLAALRMIEYRLNKEAA